MYMCMYICVNICMCIYIYIYICIIYARNVYNVYKTCMI